MDENKNNHKNRRYIDSFKYAFMGIGTVFREERNMRTHVLLGLLAVLLGFFFDLSQTEWLWIVLCVFLMIVMEIWNTVVENIVDLITNHEFHPIAKKAKDMAAAAVLVTSFLALAVGAIILLPKIGRIFF